MGELEELSKVSDWFNFGTHLGVEYQLLNETILGGVGQKCFLSG